MLLPSWNLTRLNAIKNVCPYSQCSHLSVLAILILIFPPDWVDAIVLILILILILILVGRFKDSTGTKEPMRYCIYECVQQQWLALL